MNNKNLLFIFGTRPEAIKMAPVVNRFKRSNFGFTVKVCITAQHREMLDQVLDFFKLEADYDLNLMKPNQNLFNLTADIISNLKEVFEDCNPDFTFVHGDTSTTMAASVASFYHGSKICHVEAGLRTNDIRSPFPEEMNRMVTSVLSSIHFAPTEQAKKNLLKENYDEDSIVVTGNTVIDALLNSVSKVNDEKFKYEELEQLKLKVSTDKKIILVTGHRRENHGNGFINICKGLKRISDELENIEIIYPVHLNPNVQEPVYKILGDDKNIKLIDPLSYPSFVWLMDKADLVITDSGGIQEEAPSLGKPVLVMRESTERPEAVDAGTVILVGTDLEKIFYETKELLSNSFKYRSMSRIHNPYGDGVACDLIYNYIKAQYK